MKKNSIKISILLFFLLVIYLTLYKLELAHLLSFKVLQKEHAKLSDWVMHNFLLALISYCVLYIFVVTFSLPVASFLTVTSGFLFGLWPGFLVTVLAATIGASAIFYLVRWGVRDTAVANKIKQQKKLMRQLKSQGFYYLLLIRFVPLFPFWLVNIAAAIVFMSFKAFFTATGLGIMPGTFVYVLLGTGLSDVLTKNEEINLKALTSPKIMLALTGFAFLALVLLLVRLYVEKKHA